MDKVIIKCRTFKSKEEMREVYEKVKNQLAHNNVAMVGPEYEIYILKDNKEDPS